MSRARGYTLVELSVALTLMVVMSIGGWLTYQQKRAQADIDITRRNAQELLRAGNAYWSATRTFPPSVSALVTGNYLGPSLAPVNLLGGPFTITGQNIGATPAVEIVVRAPITRSTDYAHWARALQASGPTASGVEWRRIVSEYSTQAGVRGETFKNMY